MQFRTDDIQALDKITRLNLINSLSGIKPANLIGTQSKEGQTNLAIFSSVIHLGSNPPLLGMVSRPDKDVPRHTLDNIEKQEYYTINHLTSDNIAAGHYTSAKFDKSDSEFNKCGFAEEYIDGFSAPFVEQSIIKLGMKLKSIVPIVINGTVLIIGEIVLISLPDNIMSSEGMLDLSLAKGTGISGLNTYYSLDKLKTFPYARVEELPKL